MKKNKKDALYYQKIINNDAEIINEVMIKSEKGKKIIEEIWSTMLLHKFSKEDLNIEQCLILSAVEYLSCKSPTGSTCISDEDLMNFLTDIGNYKLSEL